MQMSRKFALLAILVDLPGNCPNWCASRVCAPLLDNQCAPVIPTLESGNVWLKLSALVCSVLGRKGFSISGSMNSLDPWMCFPGSCTLNDKFVRPGGFLCRNLMSDISKEVLCIPLNWVGRKWRDLARAWPATHNCLSNPCALTGCHAHSLNWVWILLIWHAEIPGWYFR
jgi:hypothetical protein